MNIIDPAWLASHPLVAATKAKPRTGYAADPGTGPKDERCNTCAHFCRVKYANTYFKCGLRRPNWTGGSGTDIRARSPACRFWEAPQ